MQISEINIYPIKSLGGISLKEAIIEERGFQHDRRWMLVDENGDFLTQREHHQMALFKVLLKDNCLLITKDEDDLEIPFEPNSDKKIQVKIWDDISEGSVYQDEINNWFSSRLEINCRLIKMPQETRREVDHDFAVLKSEDIVSFADAYPFLLIGENSLADLNSRLENPIPMNRFRPNLVVSGTDAFAEDKWKKAKIGETIFHFVKPCARCVMTTINQQTGISDGAEPLKTLSKYRLVKKDGKSKVLFGENLIAETVGKTVKLGDKVEIIETRETV